MKASTTPGRQRHKESSTIVRKRIRHGRRLPSVLLYTDGRRTNAIRRLTDCRRAVREIEAFGLSSPRCGMEEAHAGAWQKIQKIALFYAMDANSVFLSACCGGLSTRREHSGGLFISNDGSERAAIHIQFCTLECTNTVLNSL